MTIPKWCSARAGTLTRLSSRSRRPSLFFARSRSRASSELSEDLQRKVRGSAHPMVRTHPETGEKALYVDAAYAIGIDGMTAEEAAPILGFLANFIVGHEFTCRLRWEPDMLVVWDNRLCIHQAFNDSKATGASFIAPPSWARRRSERTSGDRSFRQLRLHIGLG